MSIIKYIKMINYSFLNEIYKSNQQISCALKCQQHYSLNMWVC